MTNTTWQQTYGKPWTPSTWRHGVCRQQPCYQDTHQGEELLQDVLDSIAQLPPLVSVEEIERLVFWLQQAEQGRAFFLHAGDCAESFAEATEEHVQARAAFLHKLAYKIEGYLSLPVVILARMAGQYAKPRTCAWERRGDVELPCYRGDMINGFSFEKESRKHNPIRLWEGALCAQKTLDILRTTTSYPIGRFFVSHEALILPYEECHTRLFAQYPGYWNTSAHSLWLGERTTQSSHVEYLRGLQNPVGVKIGPRTTQVCQLLSILNPNNRSGKTILITRLGAQHVQEKLPTLLAKVTDKNHLWWVDPMHGNTQETHHGYKTRSWENILHEAQQTMVLHKEHGTRLSGLHLELTGEDVTECTGGPQGLTEEDVPKRYTSLCDPRLNAVQCEALVDALFG